MFWLIVNWIMLLQFVIGGILWLRKQFGMQPVPKHVIEEAVSTATSTFLDRQFIDDLKANTPRIISPDTGEIHQNPATGNYILRNNGGFQVFGSMGGVVKQIVGE
jgi:hypothetical protein